MTRIDPAAADALRLAADELARIHAEIVALSKRSDDSWRRELIALRRRLQQKIVDVSQLVETLPEGEGLRQLRAALSRMRSNVALHQANWPAVAIDRGDAGYKSSVSEVRAANTDFLAAVTKLLSSSGPA